MKAPNVDSLATAPCTVKCLDLRMDFLSLKQIVDLLRRFPCVEKLYIEVLLLHRYSSFRLATISSTYLVLKYCFLLMYVLFRVPHQAETITFGRLNTRLSDVLHI